MAAPHVPMSRRREIRAAVRAAALARVKKDGAAKVAALLRVNVRTIGWWKEGTWPSYPAAVRHAPLLGVRL